MLAHLREQLTCQCLLHASHLLNNLRAFPHLILTAAYKVLESSTSYKWGHVRYLQHPLAETWHLGQGC